MAKSGVWKTLKNPNFEQICFFESCSGSRMSKMHSWRVSNMFEKFLNFFHIFITFGPICARFLKFQAKKEPQITKSGVWETLKIPKFEQIGFFEGCSGSRMYKMYFGGVSNMFEKYLNFFHIFITFGPFSAKISIFLGPK